MRVTVLHSLETDNAYMPGIHVLQDYLAKGDHISINSFTNTDPRPNPHNARLDASIQTADVLMVDEKQVYTKTGRLALNLATEADIHVLAFGGGNSTFRWFEFPAGDWPLKDYHLPDRGIPVEAIPEFDDQSTLGRLRTGAIVAIPHKVLGGVGPRMKAAERITAIGIGE